MAAGLTVAEPERITENPQSRNVTDNLQFTIIETSAWPLTVAPGVIAILSSR